MKTKKKIIKYLISLNTPLNIETKKLNSSYTLRKKLTFKTANMITVISNSAIALMEALLSWTVYSTMFSAE